MTIYIDEPMAEARRRNWCHLLADSVEELHTFAASIGLKRAWFQNNPRWPHYDLSPSVRAWALRNGAREITAQEYMRRVLDGSQRLSHRQ